MSMSPTFFDSPSAFRDWLAANHDSEDELWVGFHRKATGKPTITWPESVDEALCFGWIDGIRKRLDGESYVIRFTPRRRGSHWSRVNLRKMEELLESGRVAPAGKAAYEARDAAKEGVYSFEQQQHPALSAEDEKTFRANPKAWSFFESQPPGYRKTATWWVISAKRETTRVKRLATLIADSDAGRRIAQLRRPTGDAR